MKDHRIHISRARYYSEKDYNREHARLTILPVDPLPVATRLYAST